MTASRTLRDGVRAIAARTGRPRVVVAAAVIACAAWYWPRWIARDLAAAFRAGREMRRNLRG